MNNYLKCPDCGSMAKTHLHDTVTTLYVTSSYDETGKSIPSTYQNKTVSYYVCNKCGKRFSINE